MPTRLFHRARSTQTCRKGAAMWTLIPDLDAVAGYNLREGVINLNACRGLVFRCTAWTQPGPQLDRGTGLMVNHVGRVSAENATMPCAALTIRALPPDSKTAGSPASPMLNAPALL
eukprot:scaffold99297_cov60-Phaeocystis_antarctica.AAC.3